MAITAGSNIVASDFVGTSSGASDSGKVAKLNANGQIPAGFLPITSEFTAGATHSLTTVAGQKVIVFAKGNLDGTAAGANNVLLNYNGVQKDIVNIDAGAGIDIPFSLMYTETPGAATQNVTVTSASGATLANVVIMVIKVG